MVNSSFYGLIMDASSLAVAAPSGTFFHTATRSFYGAAIDPPLALEVRFEMHRGRPVFREATDQRGVKHEVELLSKNELQESFQRAMTPETRFHRA